MAESSYDAQAFRVRLTQRMRWLTGAQQVAQQQADDRSQEQGVRTYPLTPADLLATQRDAARNVRERGGRVTEEHGFPMEQAQERGPIRPAREAPIPQFHFTPAARARAMLAEERHQERMRAQERGEGETPGRGNTATRGEDALVRGLQALRGRLQQQRDRSQDQGMER